MYSCDKIQSFKLVPVLAESEVKRKSHNLHVLSNRALLKLLCISMLSALCGLLPSSPLVWAGPSSAVTGETSGGVASPQKSSDLNKPPSEHKDFISFSVRLQAAPKEVLLPHKKKKEEVVA